MRLAISDLVPGNDGVEGMDKNSIVSDIATSGWPGEVAVTIQGKLWFSRDFGTSWNSFDLKAYTQSGSAAPAGTTINGSLKPFWAHAYDDVDGIHSSYLFLVGNLYLKLGEYQKALTYYKKLLGQQQALATDLRAHLNFNIDDTKKLRLSFNTGAARADYDQLRPNVVVSDTNQTISGGNPAVKHLIDGAARRFVDPADPDAKGVADYDDD